MLEPHLLLEHCKIWDTKNRRILIHTFAFPSNPWRNTTTSFPSSSIYAPPLPWCIETLDCGITFPSTINSYANFGGCIISSDAKHLVCWMMWCEFCNNVNFASTSAATTATIRRHLTVRSFGMWRRSRCVLHNEIIMFKRKEEWRREVRFIKKERDWTFKGLKAPMNPPVNYARIRLQMYSYISIIYVLYPLIDLLIRLTIRD